MINIRLRVSLAGLSPHCFVGKTFESSAPVLFPKKSSLQFEQSQTIDRPNTFRVLSTGSFLNPVLRMQGPRTLSGRIAAWRLYLIAIPVKPGELVRTVNLKLFVYFDWVPSVFASSNK